ncbi:MAG: GIY-YIG nuclease family protein [Deltaproteobacteria bacterium]|nr:GIY-YIG nuclease family protein [Deltaproteobacteria bacterium]
MDRPAGSGEAEWYLYMIRCHDGSLYTGISNDVARRFEKHREMGKQGAKYLRGMGPLKLVFQKKIGDKSAALKMEHKIKKLSKSQKEIIIRKGDID